jgi:prephenate dehydrogenase
MMEKFPIGIIGGTGGIGKWFADFFMRQGYTVHVSGRSSGMAPDQMAGVCSVVIVSVPIKETRGVIEMVGPHMPKDSLLTDFTSLKVDPVKAMLDSSVSEVIGLHPLFGPGEDSLSGLNIVLCPARGERWLPWLKTIFERDGARLIEAKPEEHDEMMALVQGLNHLDAALFGMTIKGSGIDMNKLQHFSTPIFNSRLDHLEKIFSNPRLYAAILAFNPHLRKFIDMYQKNLAVLVSLIEAGDTESLEAILKRLQ